MTENSRKTLPLDPAWIALGFAAAVLLGALVWLMAARGGPARPAEAPVAAGPAVAGAPAAPRAAAPPAPAPAPVPAPNPLAERLAEAERRLALLDARPAGDPALLERLETLDRRDAETQRAIAELRAATGAVLREAGEAVSGRFEQLDQGIRAALAEAERRLSRQEQAVEALVQRLPAELDRREAASRAALEAAKAESARALDAVRAEAAGAAQAARDEGGRALEALRAEAAAREAAARQAMERVTAEAAAAAQAARAEAQRGVEAVRAETAARDAAVRQALEAAAADARRAQEAVAAELRRTAEATGAAVRQAQEEAARRLGALEGRFTAADARVERLGAASALRALLDAGRPLSPALPRLGANPPAELARFAAAVPPTEASLRQRFEDAVRAARAASAPADALGRLGSVLTIRRGDAVVFGDAAEAVIERARRALEAGEIEAALAQIATLPEANRAAMQPWVQEAQSLVDARAALRRLGEG